MNKGCFCKSINKCSLWATMAAGMVNISNYHTNWTRMASFKPTGTHNMEETNTLSPLWADGGHFRGFDYKRLLIGHFFLFFCSNGLCILHSYTVCQIPSNPHLLQVGLILRDAPHTGAIDVLISQIPTLPYYSPYGR